MTKERFEISFGEAVIEFWLTRRPRKTMSISVLPSLDIEVTAPGDAPIERILEKVRLRAPWITKQLRFFSQYHPKTPERRFVSGETHLYLGRQYRLKVIGHQESGVRIVQGHIVVRSPNPDRTEVTQALVGKWLAARARAKFAERLTICSERFPDPGAFAPASLMIRPLKQRWGSMSAKGNLLLNRTLIHASTDAIDYVITHELCHIEHAHHGRAFFDLLTRVMPDWEKRKTKLERQLA